MPVYFISYTTLPTTIEVDSPFTGEKISMRPPTTDIFCEHIEATSLKEAKAITAVKAGEHGAVLKVEAASNVEVNPRHEPEQLNKADLLTQMQGLSQKIQALPEDEA